MKEQEKIQMWKAFAVAFPYMEVTQHATIEYASACFFKFVLNMFYNRLFYGPMNCNIGGASVFYCIYSQLFGKGIRFSDPELMFEDDIGRTMYATTEEKEAKTTRFWAEVEQHAKRIGDMAKDEAIKCIKRGDLRGACRHLRMLVGAIVWTKPRLRAVLVRAIPTPDEAESNRYLKGKRNLHLGILKTRLLTIKAKQIRDNWENMREICRLTWEMSVLKRIVRGEA